MNADSALSGTARELVGHFLHTVIAICERSETINESVIAPSRARGVRRTSGVRASRERSRYGRRLGTHCELVA